MSFSGKFSRRYLLLAAMISVGSALANSPTLPERDPRPNQPEAGRADVNKVTERLAAGSATSTSSNAIPAADSDDGLAFCHTPKWGNSCLLGLIIYRCGQYTFPLVPAGCAAAAANFVSLLELERFDVVLEGNTYSLPVIFTKRLERMIQDPNIQTEIQSLRILLEYYSKNRRTFDLLEWFRAASDGSHEATLEKISVLLQDTSPVQIQVHYLKKLHKTKKFNAATVKAIAELERVNELLSYPVLQEAQWQTWLKLYPQTKNIEAESTPLIYHFYPMAYLTHKLRGHGDRLATFIPFLFNTEYLLQDLDPQAWPLRHPAPFKVTPELTWKMKDMYLGLAGSLWGIRQVDKTPGLDAFQTGFSANPYGTMRTLFWDLP